MKTSNREDIVTVALARATEMWEEGQPSGPEFDNPDDGLLSDASLIRRLAEELLALRKLLASGHGIMVGPHPQPPVLPDRRGHWPMPAFPTDHERLNWLESRRTNVTAAGVYPGEWFCGYSQGTTIRGAIDAAIDEEIRGRRR